MTYQKWGKLPGFTILFFTNWEEVRRGLKNDHPRLIYPRTKSDFTKWKEKIKSQTRTCFCLLWGGWSIGDTHDPLLLLEFIVLWLILCQLGNYQEEGGWGGGLVLNKAQACNGTDRAKKNQPGVVSSLRPAAKAARVSPRPKGKGRSSTQGDQQL